MIERDIPIKYIRKGTRERSSENKKMIVTVVKQFGQQIDGHFVLSFEELFDHFYQKGTRIFYTSVSIMLELLTQLEQEGQLKVFHDMNEL